MPFYNLLRPFGIRELMRTGRIAMSRGGTEGRGGQIRAQTNGAGEDKGS